MEDARSSARARGWAAALCAAVALTVPQGCRTPYIGTTSASFLKRVRESSDPNIRFLAYNKLAISQSYDNEEQRLEAIRVLSKNLAGKKEPTASRAVICRTLGELRMPEARPALIKAFEDEEGIVRAEAYRGLGKAGKPEDATLLAQKMAVDQIQDCRIAAIEGLGELKAKDWRVVGMLVEGMEHDSPAIRYASLQALREITDQDLGVKPAPWREYVLKQIDDEREAARKKVQEDAKTAAKDKDKDKDRRGDRARAKNGGNAGSGTANGNAAPNPSAPAQPASAPAPAPAGAQAPAVAAPGVPFGPVPEAAVPGPADFQPPQGPR